MNDLFIQTPTKIDERPMNGYTYIYIYSFDSLYLYVGQTIQSIDGRFNNHLSDNSGARYANIITYFQIKSKYANYAEGYLGYRLNGICQGNLPNPEHHKDSVPKEIRKELQLIGNKLSGFKKKDDYLKVGKAPLFYHKKETFCDGNILQLFNLLIKEDNQFIWKHFIPSMKYTGFKGIGLFELSYDGNPFYTIMNNKDYRPISFVEIITVDDLKRFKNLKSNFPVYGIISVQFFKKYEDIISRIIEQSSIGFLIKDWNKISVHKKWEKPFRNKYDINANEAVCLCKNKRVEYFAQCSPYGYFQCA